MAPAPASSVVVTVPADTTTVLTTSRPSAVTDSTGSSAPNAPMRPTVPTVPPYIMIRCVDSRAASCIWSCKDMAP
jgi:hypothetical protein